MLFALSKINIATLDQRNVQIANNVSLFSLGATQVVSQGAANNANVIQG
jgi:hypothetical protein